MATTIIEKEEKLSRKEREKEATKKELIGVTLDMLKIKQKKILNRTGVKEKVEELNNQLKIKSILTKSVKWTIPLTIIFALLSVLLPTERTVYLMTAAYATQTIAQNDRVQKIGSDVLEVVEKKLSEMKGGNSNDND